MADPPVLGRSGRPARSAGELNARSAQGQLHEAQRTIDLIKRFPLRFRGAVEQRDLGLVPEALKISVPRSAGSLTA